MVTYINRKQGRDIETVDECDTRKEALALVREYALSDSSALYYVSSRPCKAWRE